MSSSDQPITAKDQDLFGHARIAHRLAAEAAMAPESSGFVIGLSGPWGSGKSSITNLVESELDATEVGR